MGRFRVNQMTNPVWHYVDRAVAGNTRNALDDARDRVLTLQVEHRGYEIRTPLQAAIIMRICRPLLWGLREDT